MSTSNSWGSFYASYSNYGYRTNNAVKKDENKSKEVDEDIVVDDVKNVENNTQKVEVVSPLNDTENNYINLDESSINEETNESLVKDEYIATTFTTNNLDNTQNDNVEHYNNLEDCGDVDMAAQTVNNDKVYTDTKTTIKSIKVKTTEKVEDNVEEPLYTEEQEDGKFTVEPEPVVNPESVVTKEETDVKTTKIAKTTKTVKDTAKSKKSSKKSKK